MIALIQRVSQASVSVDNQEIARIGKGILSLVGVEKGDQVQDAIRLAERVLVYRIFSDEQDKMNLSLSDVGGQLLVVSQFTLAANTQKGRRPSFSSAAPPQRGEVLFLNHLEALRERYPKVKTGRFGADMQVSLVNDGPVSFILSTQNSLV